MGTSSRSSPTNTHMSTPTDSATQSASSAAADATGGTIGSQPGLREQATTLGSHAFDYAKGMAGFGKEKAKETAGVEGAAPGSNEPPRTLHDLSDEARGLTANLLETTKGYLVPKEEQAQKDASSYLDKGKGMAANLIDTAQSYIAVSKDEADKAASDAKATMEGKTDEAKDSASKVAADASSTLDDKTKPAQDKANEGFNKAVGKI